MVKSRSRRTVLYGMFIGACLFSCFACTALIYSNAKAISTISQGYITGLNLAVGSIVSLAPDSSDRVIAATSSNSDNIIGVVINQNDTMISLSNGSDKEVQVITSGTTQVLVSDINGTIVRGDHITSSPIAGVGMKASGNVRVIGIAEGDLTNATKQSYQDKSKISHDVKIGTVPLLVSVAYFFKEPEKTLIPSSIQKVANALAGRSVSTLPIIISAVIFIVMIIVVASIVFSMVKSSIISVGRNPMSQSAVYRDLIQMSALVLVIMSVGIAAIYLVLTRM